MSERTHSLRTGVALLAGAVLFIGAAAQVAGAQEGKALYEKNCGSCHGTGGKGDGPAAKALKPPPQDFATALKGKAEADVVKVITEGKVAAKAHPSFAKKLKGDEIKAVAQYVKELSGK